MNSLSRNECLDRLRGGETWDILVIGGGATGLGTAVDAASRGYRTLLLEARDFAHGTSSRSTKLIHGGVRYLAQGNIPLVREALHERGLLLQNAPHLVHCRDFVVPAYHSWQLPYYGMGLWLYDRLAGELSLGRSRWISRAETLTRVPTMRSQGLRGGILYTDGQFDDARLAIVLARTLADLGGSALNYLPVTALTRQGGQLAGATARDLETGEEFTVTTRTVVNASGVNADEIRRLDEPGAPTLIAPSQGAHIVLDRSFLPGETAVMVPKTDDGRVLFAIPWSGRVLVGTTDTAMATLPLEPRPLEGELDYLLDHARQVPREGPRPGRHQECLRRPAPDDTARRRQGHRDIPAIAGTCRHRLGIGPGDGHRWEVDDLSRDGPGRGRPRGAGGQTSRPSLRDSVIEAARLVSADR